MAVKLKPEALQSEPGGVQTPPVRVSLTLLLNHARISTMTTTVPAYADTQRFERKLL